MKISTTFVTLPRTCNYSFVTEEFLLDIRNDVPMDEIPAEFIINVALK